MARDESQDTTGAEATEPAQGGLKRLLRRWWVLVLLALLLIPGFVLGVVAASHAGNSTAVPSEVTLGDFQFVAANTPGNPVSRAEFRLHVSLLERAERDGRELLAAKQYRVRQQVEQLLRRAHGADFEDPALTELKRQLQELVNQTLGKRVIEEVIITGLSIDWAASPAPSAPVSNAGGAVGAVEPQRKDPGASY